MKKILLISGSNRSGNTEYLLKKINEQIKYSELILLRNKKIEYCKGCLACHRKNRCVIEDDINDIIGKIVESDYVVFGVPNYFDNVSGLFKNFMDRLHPLYKSLDAKGKKTIFIYVGGGGEEGTKEELHISVRGFVKYLELNVIGEFSFKSLNIGEIKNQNDNVTYMVEEIKSMIDGNKK